uniref:ABC transporter ATP-binding protein n=1 Tax=Roseihalotalea indica TaxID=2867963 RepID=A0AA49JJH7_9BACT|nr:ABC transporter ATP-binding protein [Tunicatimonas sp. TK19036]
MNILLQTQSLSVHYPETQQNALTSVDITIPEGKVVSMVGESGSGKTTLLKTLAGLLEPAEGSVIFDGKPLPPPSRRLVPGHPDIRMVFQDFGLSPNLTVFENIWHVLRAYNREYRQERVEELLTRCRLTGLENQHPRTLSGGEKQRVALARALAEEPRLLLMDEPFGQLDTLLKQQLKFEIADFLAESSMTMIMVTHDPRDALGIADTIVVLQAGEVAQVASPTQTYTHPVNAYVAQLFGPVNIFSAEIWQRWYPSLSVQSPSLGIRAEQVQLRPANDKNNRASDRLLGQVAHTSYQGFYDEIIVQVAENQAIFAFHPTGVLSEGQTVEIVIDLAHLIPFSS